MSQWPNTANSLSLEQRKNEWKTSSEVFGRMQKMGKVNSSKMASFLKLELEAHELKVPEDRCTHMRGMPAHSIATF